MRPASSFSSTRVPGARPEAGPAGNALAGAAALGGPNEGSPPAAGKGKAAKRGKATRAGASEVKPALGPTEASPVFVRTCRSHAAHGRNEF